MRRAALFLSISLAALPLCTAQDFFLPPAGGLPSDGGTAAASADSEELALDPELESSRWASGLFAAFAPDMDMCDAGTALLEDGLRSQAMRQHPEWPVWAVDLALEEARDSYLRSMLFPE